MNTHVIITLLMMLAIIILLFKGVSSPGVIFTFLPILACILMGYAPKEINGFISDGLKSVGGTLYLMVFAVLYFGILHDAGVFNAVVRFVMRFLGNSVLGSLCIATAVSIATQLDGSGATTALCTIPAMKPIFDKQKIRPQALLLVESLASGVFCLLPWAPGIVEGSSYVGVEVYDVFRYVLPLFIFATVMLFVYNVPISIVEKRHGAGLSNEEFAELKASLHEKMTFPYGGKVALFDGLFTLVLMALLLAGKIPSNVSFGFGYAVLLLVTYRNPKAQGEYLKKQAPLALNMAFTMLGVATLVGVNNGTGALGELAVYISSVAPEGVLRHIPIILCIFSMLLSITIGGAKNSVVLPAMIPLVEPFGFTAVQIFGCVFTAGIISANLSLFNASPYLALGLAGVEMKDHLRYSLLPVYGFSLILVAFMVVTGMMPV